MPKFFVRTTKERKFNYDLEYTELVDYEHKPVESFISQLKLISEYDAVLLEDDLILCKDFKNKIEAVIAQYPNYVINFYYMPGSFFTTHLTQGFCWNQCTYYPKGVAKVIAERMEEVKRKRGIVSIPYDTLEDMAMQELCMTNLVYRPCLVQHASYKSIINMDSYRDTIYFEDYLNQLGITYEESYQLKNRDKLHALRNEDRKRYC